MWEQNLCVHGVCWQRVCKEVAKVFGKEATQSRGGKLSESPSTQAVRKNYSEAARPAIPQPLFRRATAHHAVWNPSEARKDYNQAMELDPSLTSTVEKSLAKLSLEEKQKDMSDKERYRRAFSDIKTSR